MRVRHTNRRAEKVELMMTPMIDIVFQLLVFFIMTFKIVAVEGDFNIKMPVSAPSAELPPPDQLPPIKVTLQADAGGELAGIFFGKQGLGNDDRAFVSLRKSIISMIGDDPGPDVRENTEVELDCDYGLKYGNVVRAITAVSGYVDENGKVVTLVEKIKFTPPKAP